MSQTLYLRYLYEFQVKPEFEDMLSKNEIGTALGNLVSLETIREINFAALDVISIQRGFVLMHVPNTSEYFVANFRNFLGNRSRRSIVGSRFHRKYQKWADKQLLREITDKLKNAESAPTICFSGM